MNPRVILPLAAIAVGVLGAVILVSTTSPVEGKPSERIVRAVRVVPVESRTVRLDVRSQGTVTPRTESELIPEVAGRVVWTAPALVSGGFFEEGDVLMRIDKSDYQASVDRARAALSRARGENKHATEVLRRQRDLKQRNVVSTAALDDAERNARVADAGLREAQVALEQAQRDLARTEIRAPFRGRVREEQVDVGQFVNRGQSFGTIYAIDYVEVRLPIADAQLAYLDVPLWNTAPLPEQELPQVTLSASFAGKQHSWQGRIVRTEGEIDPKSRLVHVVARVAHDPTPGVVPLPAGLFVQARIEGSVANGVAVIPRQALLEDGQVLVVDAEDRLRMRSVSVLRVEGDDVLIAEGLADGERVCVSSIQAPVDGMVVRPVAERKAGA